MNLWLHPLLSLQSCLCADNVHTSVPNANPHLLDATPWIPKPLMSHQAWPSRQNVSSILSHFSDSCKSPCSISQRHYAALAPRALSAPWPVSSASRPSVPIANGVENGMWFSWGHLIRWEPGRIVTHNKNMNNKNIIKTWIPPFAQTPACWQSTSADIMSPNVHNNPRLRAHHSQWTEEENTFKEMKNLPEVTEWIERRDTDLNPGSKTKSSAICLPLSLKHQLWANCIISLDLSFSSVK